MKYLLMDIGCIECGVESAVVGVFTDDQVAKKECDRLNSNRKFTWADGGQHIFDVFPLPKEDEIMENYR